MSSSGAEPAVHRCNWPTRRPPRSLPPINSASTISRFTVESKKEVGSLGDSSTGWSWISEPIGISKADAFSKLGLLEQINTTADRSDYLWYSLSTDFGDDTGSQTVLHIQSLGHALHAFINGKHTGSGSGNGGNAKVNVDISITLVAGKNTIDLLSLTVGLQNYGAFFDTWGAGITGPVILKGLTNGTTLDLSSQLWTYQVNEFSSCSMKVLQGKVAKDQVCDTFNHKYPESIYCATPTWYIVNCVLPFLRGHTFDMA